MSLLIRLTCFCLIILSAAFAQKGSIKGKIFTSEGAPASSVNAFLKELNRSAVSEKDGTFYFTDVKQGSYTVVVSFTGLETQTTNVDVIAGAESELKFTLKEDSKKLAEIVITASKNLNENALSLGKIPIDPMDLPQSATIINKDIMQRQQVITMSDALQNANGVYIMGTTGGYQEEIAARGYAFSSSNTFKNGARFNNGIKTEFSSVEKIEILKGGSAILFGNVAAGGVLNIVTKKPKFENGGEVSFRTGSYDLYKPAFDIYGAFNNSKVAAYRLNGSYEKAGSFRDGVKSERFYVNPSFLFRLSNKTDLLIEGDYLKDNRTPDFGVGAINYEFINVPRSRTLNVPWASLQTEQYTATATATHRFTEKVQLRGVLSYQNFDNLLFSAARPASVAITPDGNWLRGLQKSQTAENYYYTSLDLTAKATTGKIGHTFLFGADADKYKTKAYTYATYRNEEITSSNKNVYDSINIFDPSTFNLRQDVPFIPVDRITTSPINRYGVYIQDLISVLDNLKVLAGVRYSYQQNQRATVDSLKNGTSGSINAYKSDAFSPRFGVVYQPVKTMSLFTSYTNSFTVNTGVDIYTKALPASVIDQYEIGMKNDLFKGAVSANITLYRIVNSNLAQTALTLADGTANANNNIKELTGETTSKGIEVDIMTRPAKGFNIIAGYSYNNMRYTGVNGNTVNGNIKGDRLRYNPAHTANASVFYKFKDDGKLKGFYAGAGAFYTGDRLAGRNPTNSLTNTNKLMHLPDYTTVDINAGYDFNNIAIRLKLSNLFDKLSYNAHDDNSINPIAPRQFAATFAYKF